MDDEPGLRVIVTLARQSVEHCDLASGVVVRNGEIDVAEASEPVAAEIDRLQRTLGEGPGVLACATSSIISSDDLGTDPRWPTLGAHARRHGVAAMVVVPLIVEPRLSTWCGWISLYSRDAEPFTPPATVMAETLGRYYASSIGRTLDAQNFATALASRDLIGQAKGIIMARLNVDDEQAFTILKRASQHGNRRLNDVATTVVRSRGHQGVDGAAYR